MKPTSIRVLTRLFTCGLLTLNAGCSNEVRGDDYVRLDQKEVEMNSHIAAQQEAALRSGWEAFKRAFVRKDGRVIDTYTGVSHSEGQSYGMLISTYVDDRNTFDSVWNWTKSTLRVRGDNLFAWKYVSNGSSGHIPDKNNASDGGIAIAWALIRAAELWQEPAYLDEAQIILDDLRAHMVISQDGRFLLLPGTEGFAKDGKVTVNLSYYLYPAFEVFAEVDTEPDLWRMLIDEGVRLTEESLLGDRRLPTDWVTVGDTIEPGEHWDPVFSYDAIRIPLYLFWGGKLKDAAKFHVALQMTWRRHPASRFPARVNVHGAFQPTDQETVLHGMQQVYELACEPSATAIYAAPSAEDLVAIEEGYYSSSLSLLVACARLDALRRGY